MSNSDFTATIERVTADLKSIQERLISISSAHGTSAERDAVLESMLQENLLNDFKTAVDHMRHLLWSYVEANTLKRGGDMQATMQQLRIQRVTEMLRVLAPSVEEAKVQHKQETQSFFEIIQEIAETTMDRTMKKQDNK